MARKNRRREETARTLPADGASYLGVREVIGPSWTNGATFLVRRIGSHAAVKLYVCPGCNQNIPPGIAHVVAWPKDYGRGAEDRRHWHSPCWERR